MTAILQTSIIEARQEAAQTGRRILDVLEAKLALQPEEFVFALAEALQYPAMKMQDLRDKLPAFDLLPYSEALNRGCVALFDKQGGVCLVFADPFDHAFQMWVTDYFGSKATYCLAHTSDISAYLALQEDAVRTVDVVLQSGQDGQEQNLSGVEQLSFQSISEDSSQVVKAVNSTIFDALRNQVSDIHLKTFPSGMVIKYRIDGVLTKVGTIQGLGIAEQMISRIKVMAELDISEKRVPQDGRFRVQFQERHIDLRVSVMPGIYGEDVVLRILDKRTLSDGKEELRLDSFGFDATSLAQLRKLAQEPYGMLLVTGPTGSGKTTTLYGVISEINNGQDNIVTIEDPVEYNLPGVLQIPVNEKKGLTFSRGLRSLLRHDPDKILVGEIRDEETAQIAIQSALTGHLVFTTVHANNVFDVIGRFLHMGVDPYNFISSLNGVVAQRLLRMTCMHCKVEVAHGEDLLRASGIDPVKARQVKFVEGKGCGHCRGTGFKGRRAIAEILLLTDDIREMIIAKEPIRLIKEAARQNGTRFLRDAALDLVYAGHTSLPEINRVTFAA